MEEPKMTESRPVQPVITSVIGTGDASRLPNGILAETPGVSHPNVVVKVIPPIAAILVRFINAYLTTLVGLLMAGMVGHDVIPAHDFASLFVSCMKLSLAGPVVDLIKNLITILGKLEGKYPLMTGNV